MHVSLSFLFVADRSNYQLRKGTSMKKSFQRWRASEDDSDSSFTWQSFPSCKQASYHYSRTRTLLASFCLFLITAKTWLLIFGCNLHLWNMILGNCYNLLELVVVAPVMITWLIDLTAWSCCSCTCLYFVFQTKLLFTFSIFCLQLHTSKYCSSYC